VGIQSESTSAVTDLKKTHDSVRREVLYNIIIEIGVSMKLVRLINRCLNETYSKVHIDKHLSHSFPIQNCLKEDIISQLLLNFALEYVIRKAKVNFVELKLNGTYQVLVSADDVSMIGDN
jgi:hypothetical protein